MKPSHSLLLLGVLLALPIAPANAQSPSLSPIADVTLNAGSSATVNVVAVDAGGGQITLLPSLPSFATLNSPTIGMGTVVTTLTLSPSAVHVGTYTAAVTATAGGVSDTEIFQITVNPTGSAQAPQVTAPAFQEITEGENLQFTVVVNDPDTGGIASLDAAMLPGGATFTPGASNTSGVFSWAPAIGAAGDYDVLFTAVGTTGLSGGAATHIHVAGAPTLGIDPIDDVTVQDGSSISVAVHASGLPGALITLTASLPSFATLNSPGAGTGSVSTTITVAPPVGSAGTYHASVTATSEGEFITEAFDIVVTGTGGSENHPPVLSAPAFATVAAGATLSFDVTAVDPDGDHVDLFGSALPPGSSFLDHGDNTGTFTWTPVAGQVGTHIASFSGLDNRGGSGAASTEITVTGETPENHPPALTAPPTAQVDEGVLLSFTVTAADPDGDPVALSASSLPMGASFADQGGNSGLFSWTPGFDQAGVYEVAFLGEDGRGGTGTASTVITVLDAGSGVTCTISGQLEFCVGQTTELCGPEGMDGYSWTGPDGFAASTRCITVGVAGSYELTVEGGGGQTDTCSATLVQIDCDGEPGEVLGAACLIRPYKPRGETTCLRIRPVDGSFDVQDVVLSSITLAFRGQAIAALSEGTRIDVVCPHDNGRGHGNGDGDRDDGTSKTGRNGDDRHGHGDCDDDDEDDDGGDGRDNDHHCAISCNNSGGRGHHGDHCHGPGHVGADCDTLGIRACFSTDALQQLFADADLPCDLLHAQVRATLTNGDTIVATFGQKNNPRGDDDGHGHGDEDTGGGDDDADAGTGGSNPGGNNPGGSNPGGDNTGDDDAGGGDTGQNESANPNEGGNGGTGSALSGAPDHGLNVSIGPNPLNPSTQMSFTMAREGRVRVAVYDMQGRLVKTLMDETRATGRQRVEWDGSNARNQTVPSGVYFLHIQTPGGLATHRVAVVK